MHDFVIKEVINADMGKELADIGFDKSYLNEACKKFVYKNLKIYNLSMAQANILKQTAISVGADCATHRETITAKIDKTDCLLGGSYSQLKKIAAKLVLQPFGLKFLGEQIDNFLSFNKTNPTKIVGILNLTQNSFSDGGEFYELTDALNHLHELISDGADIIDIGAESTKPYSTAVGDNEQLAKLIPVLEYIRANNIDIPVSIDTRSSIVAKRCLQLGAVMINDVSGFDYDKGMPGIIAKYNAKVIIQHSKCTPDKMQDNPEYDNLMDAIYLSLKNKIELAVLNGIKCENIIVDPGIGFGKTRKDNFEILKRIEELRGLGYPLMLGLSRKSILNMPDKDNFTKDIYSTALHSVAICKGIDYLRVHNVKLCRGLVDLLKQE